MNYTDVSLIEADEDNSRLHMKTSRTRMVLILVVLGVALLSLPLVALLAFEMLIMRGEPYYVAEYPDKSFTWQRDRQIHYMDTGGEERSYKVADVYLKLRNGSIIKLSDISEETARSWVWTTNEWERREQIRSYTGSGGIEVNCYDIDGIGRNTFSFRFGRLADASICDGVPDESPLAGVQIAPRADGEFLSFPMDPDDVTRVFGKPDAIRKIRPRLNWGH